MSLAELVLLSFLLVNLDDAVSLSEQDIILTKLHRESISATIIASLPSSILIDCAIVCCLRDDCQYIGMGNETSCVLLSNDDSSSTISLPSFYAVNARKFIVSMIIIVEGRPKILSSLINANNVM